MEEQEPAPSHIHATIDGNRLTLLEQGGERLDAVCRLIGEATEKLQLFYYTFAADASGERVRAAVIDACHRGVDVSIMIDGFGCSGTPQEFFAPLREAGCTFGCFGAKLSTRYLIRNHQKMTIADGRIALIGGFNIADDYFAGPAENGWHDMGLLIEGPAVAQLCLWYDRLARWTTGKKPKFRALRHIVRRWDPGEGNLRWLIGGPVRRLSTWALCVKRDMTKAMRIDMVEAYFSPPRSLRVRIGRIARRRHARLITAAKSDNDTTIAAARLLYGPLLRQGVTVYEYQPSKLHMKLIVIDDIVYIGSANFDMRSLFLNLELMLRVEDADFADAMRAFIDRRADFSEQITPALHKKRTTLTARIVRQASYLMVGVMDYTVTRRLNFPSR